MKLKINDKGIVSVEGMAGGEYAVYAGPTRIGSISASGSNFPLHGLSANYRMASLYGVTARSLDSQGAGGTHAVDISDYIEQFGRDDLISEAQGLIRGGKWAVYGVWVGNKRNVTADIGIVVPISLSGHGFTVECDGVEASETIVYSDQYFEQSHWFMPAGNILGVRCKFEMESIESYLEFSLEFDGGQPENESYGPILNYTDVKLLDGLPDLPRIRRIASANANHNSFLNGGRTVFVRLSRMAGKYGVDLRDGSARVLDWGVGCGRVIRHFGELPLDCLHGIDIDQDNVDYCNSTLGSDSYVVGLDPPTPLESNSYDLIYSCSVLSHLTEDAIDKWLTEINRLLSERGVALLSFNGSANSASYLSRRPKELRGLLRRGFFDKDVNHELDGFIPGNDYYRATFATDDWWRTKFESHGDLVAIEHAVVNGHQDIAVLRKRP